MIRNFRLAILFGKGGEEEWYAAATGAEIEDSKTFASCGEGGRELGDPVLGLWTWDESGGADEDLEWAKGLGACWEVRQSVSLSWPHWHQRRERHTEDVLQWLPIDDSSVDHLPQLSLITTGNLAHPS